MTLSRDVKLRLFGPFALFVFGRIFFRLKVFVGVPFLQQLQASTVALVCGYIGWELGRVAVQAIQRHYPGIPRTRQRLYRLVLVIVGLANVNSLLRSVINYVLDIGVYKLSLIDHIETTGIQIVYACVYVGVYEGMYLIQQWRQIYQEKEELMKTEWQARLDSLKNQVNPHFLFNALNALSALIDESPAQASKFVDELSKVYRYMLQSNDRELTTLEAELGFIRAYAHLLQTRYGTGILVQINVPDQYLTYSIPSLSLQLLVENAVKHNIVASGKPLTIEITTTCLPEAIDQSTRLLVRNNLQRKNGQVISNRVGLSNISAKYHMLAKTDIMVQDQNGHFSVVLPLLSPGSLPTTP
ncbi:sensor histidine kinase [Spirosoma jeollabukense]